MACLSGCCLKGCLKQILLGPFMNNLPHLFIEIPFFQNETMLGHKKEVSDDQMFLCSDFNICNSSMIVCSNSG